MSVSKWHKNLWCAWMLALSVPLCPLAGSAKSSETWLITPEEAAMAPAVDANGISGGGLTDIGREDINAGPEIEILKPADGGRVPSPVEVAVRFIPRLGAVDLASLKVSIVKFITIDITDRIRPYATAEGIQLKEANIPSGKHRVRITVSDKAGGVSIKELWLEVL
ncbi:MAG: hypothetical protein NT179_12205 [Nitrospirae bacterium]|nr:hypothetical protein [Nitrospirota bacterium]